MAEEKAKADREKERAAAAAAATATGAASVGGTKSRACSKCKKAAPNAAAKFCSSCAGKIEDVWTAASDSVSTAGTAQFAAGGTGAGTVSANSE